MQVEYETTDKKKSPYKINIGDEVKVHRFDYQKEKVVIPLYWVTILKKEFGRKTFYRKMLKFRKDVSIKDGTIIRINDMFEDAMVNSKDKYNAVWCLFILDFDIVEEPDEETKAMIDYQQNISENKENSIYDDLIVF